MTKKVVIQFVKYDSVSVILPEGFPENIEELTEDQKEFLAEIADDQMYESTRDSDWSVDERDENGGFLEVVED
jgi:hypothetical protein